ncbi:MAG: copper amine oxidase N-terminal domain-containing protein [Tissierellia bacterium]|nr:copper amine oxidase N-terminal domain-containing protein [Tissierellia bacterium]
MKIKIKKCLPVALALVISTSPLATYAEGGVEPANPGMDMPISDEVRPILDEIEPIKDEVAVPNYIEFKGKIKEINSKEGRFSFLAENDLEEGLDKLVVHMTDRVILLDDESMDFISLEDLEEGMEVSVFYDKETIMLMSYPAQLEPDVVVVRNEEAVTGIMIDKFDEDLLSDDGSLRLIIKDEVELIDRDGKEIEREDLQNKDLIVFYSIVMDSYPMQTIPEKVIAIRNHEVKVFDHLKLNGEEFKLDNEMYYGEERELMLPLRQLAEALGYEVEWVQESRTVNLTKGEEKISLTIGLDKYQYYNLEHELGTAPELVDERTYVPLSFMKSIIYAHVEVTMDGVLEVTRY